jgi:hypothetical protein
MSSVSQQIYDLQTSVNELTIKGILDNNKINNLETLVSSQDSKITNIQSKNSNQDVILNTLQSKNNNQDIDILALNDKYNTYYKGETGEQGPIGFTGVMGAIGEQGPTGIVGPTGEQGLKGDTGEQGVAGADGVTGPQGADGADGVTGPQGIQGFTGSSGAAQLGTANTWTELQTFNSGITVPGAVITQGNTTIGDASSDTLTINSTTTFNQPPTMSGSNITANTIPSSAINGGISVSLPTTTMATRAATEVGYSQSVIRNSGFTALNGNQGNTITSLTLNGPAGSVWIIWGSIEFLSNNVAFGYIWGLAKGDTNWSANGNLSTNMISGYREESMNTKPRQLTTSVVYTLPSGANDKIITVGLYPYAAGVVPSYAIITATRIA